MRSPLAAVMLLIATPAFAQSQPRLGARTTSPEAMVAQMNQASPEEELRQQIAAADAHPLGSLENPIRVGGPEGVAKQRALQLAEANRLVVSG